MRILFLENRQQTFFWEAIASKLEEDGHEIHWIVQNANFLPSVGYSHVIPYPNGHRPLPFPEDADAYMVASSDRNINYFGGTSSHYGYYDNEIARVLERVHPQVVFGEATLFHELLCIRQCRRRNILYLQPTSCRYPLGRFSFYLYETQVPFHGSDESIAENDCLAMVRKIASRDIQPDYMKREKPHGMVRTNVRAMRNGLTIASAYFAGERYNTPSPLARLVCEHRLRRNKSRWEKLAARVRTSNRKFRILYPLQMQPESTIDVWGNAYRDQVRLIASLLRAGGDNAVILVKPNPKSKYELSDDLLALMTSSDMFIPVSHQIQMQDVLGTVDLIVTVTGTIAIEAIFAGQPIVTLTKTICNTVPQCIYLDATDGLSDVIRQIRNKTYPKASDTHKIDFLNLLTRTSYRGIISNPYSMPTCLRESNVRDVHLAFRDILEVIRRDHRRVAAQSLCSITSNIDSGFIKVPALQTP